MTGFIKSDRRFVLKSAGAIGAAALISSKASAQQSLGEILRSPQRGNWDDQFDASSSRKTTGDSRLPILSPQTAAYAEAGINDYRNIVGRGGWPRVNATQRLKVGVTDNSVRDLRRRLQVSGDMNQNTGNSSTFDTFLDAGLKRFQTRHGMVADGVMGNYTLAALNVDAGTRLNQLETNLVRLRAMSGFLGDRYVMEMLKQKGWQLGAENSGHVINLNHTSTGDGIIAALNVLTAICNTGKSLFELRQGMTKLPQVLVNVRFSGDSDPLVNDDVVAAVDKVNAILTGRGRVLLRKSGTEPLIRVMVEGPEHDEVTALANNIADAVKLAC